MERKNLLITYLHYLILYVMINLSNIISIVIIKGKLALAIAVLWMILTIGIYFVIRKNISKYTMITYSLINAILGGIAISSYYSLRNVVPYNPFALIMVFGILMLLNYRIYLSPVNKVLYTRYNLLVTIIFLIASLFIWFEKDKSLGSSLVFMGIVYLCFSIALSRVVKKGLSWHSMITLSSLLMFGGLFIVVIVVLTEGDALDALDAGFLESPRKNKV